MSNEKRFVLCMVMMVLWMLAWPYLARRMGLMSEPKNPPADAVVAKDAEKAEEPPTKPEAEAKPETPKAQEPAKALAQPTETPPKKPDVEIVNEPDLVLGSVTDHDPDGYRLEAWLTQKGAGIDVLLSSRFDAEYENGVALKRPLKLIQRDTTWPASFSLMLNAEGAAAVPVPPEGDTTVISAAREAEDWLDRVTWEVVKDEQGRIRRPVSMVDPATQASVEGQAIVFRTKAPSGLIVTKTFRLGKNIDGLEVELKFESLDRERKVAYNLIGPHGIPIEGEWYTSTFRDLVFGQLNGKTTEILTVSAYDIAKAGDKETDNTALPLHFTGVENQYFATLIEPDPPPTGQDDRWDSRAVAMVHRNEKDLQKSDICVQIKSRPITVGPDQAVVHTYRLFAGPKIASALRPYEADGMASYRKYGGGLFTPFTATATYLATNVITPTLAFTYAVTARVARFFGGTRGNYGIAIILLTIAVRAMMFPIGRKQALAAQRMQELQPLLKQIQEKYKEDKEKQTKETFALYKKHGVNPVAGCLPALIQIPIFMGLWQALNTSVPLRHATFLWIHDLAAPDMLFRFPFEVPFLGPWLNLLPFVVVALMLIQTKLFSPPATTPEAEAQQKMMKYMMVFMGVMFYKVPSGLGLYFITSSLWAIGERLLLPKVTHARAVAPELGDGDAGEEKPTGLRGGKPVARPGMAHRRRPSHPDGSPCSWNVFSRRRVRIRPTERWPRNVRTRDGSATRAIPGPDRGGVDGVETSDG